MEMHGQQNVKSSTYVPGTINKKDMKSCSPLNMGEFDQALLH